MKSEERATVHIIARERGTRETLSRFVSAAGWHARAYARLPHDFARCTVTPAECLLLDVPGIDVMGLDWRLLIARLAMRPLIVISSRVDVSTAVAVMKLGVFHFMERPYSEDELLDRLEAALARDATDRQAIERHADLRRRAESLTAREREVMALVAAGKVSKVIARDLGLSDRTVGMYRAKVMDKMGALSIADLVRMHLTLAENQKTQPRPAAVRFAPSSRAMTTLVDRNVSVP